MRDPQRCPGFLAKPLQDARELCEGAGGRLRAAAVANIHAADINRDGRDEYLFEYAGNVDCEGAASVFSCGSLGCPLTLYGHASEQGKGQRAEQRTEQGNEHGAGGWRELGSIFFVQDPAGVELLESSARGGFRDLRIARCSAEACVEQWYYRWNGTAYEQSHVDVRGARVEFADSIHGLYPLTATTALLELPRADAAEIARYDADTEVAIVGTAVSAAQTTGTSAAVDATRNATPAETYYYVSPCNACASGFVPRSALRIP